MDYGRIVCLIAALAMTACYDVNYDQECDCCDDVVIDQSDVNVEIEIVSAEELPPVEEDVVEEIEELPPVEEDVVEDEINEDLPVTEYRWFTFDLENAGDWSLDSGAHGYMNDMLFRNGDASFLVYADYDQVRIETEVQHLELVAENIGVEARSDGHYPGYTCTAVETDYPILYCYACNADRPCVLVRMHNVQGRDAMGGALQLLFSLDVVPELFDEYLAETR